MNTILNASMIAEPLGLFDCCGVSDGTAAAIVTMPEIARTAAKRAYQEAGITNPREQLDLMEVHDCLSITELVTMEDLGVPADSEAVKDGLDGFHDRLEGGVPCHVDGGLKCFGHSIAVSGLRMAYGNYNHLLDRAGERHEPSPSLGLTHNLGGVPYLGIAAISILGLA